MIIAVGSDKGSPGATTLATVLAMVWPSERVLSELDPRGADLPYRLHAPDGTPLAVSPSVATLAVDSRPGSAVRAPYIYEQQTSVGVPMIVGEVSSRRFGRIVGHLPAVADAFTEWPGTVIADLGCLQPPSPALHLASHALAVILVTRADTESLGHLRDRAEELSAQLGGPRRSRSPLVVVVRAGRSDPAAARSRAETLLASTGLPVPVLGVLPDDPATVTALYDGKLSRRVMRSPLLTAAREVAVRLQQTWPELTSAPPPDAQFSAEAVAAGGLL